MKGAVLCEKKAGVALHEKVVVRENSTGGEEHGGAQTASECEMGLWRADAARMMQEGRGV